MTEGDGSAPAFLQEGGEMGRLMRALDWSATPLGPPAAWPQSLKTAVSLLLRARQPMFIGWGRQFISFYNDGYIPICGRKHPHALAQPMAQVWSEIWDTLGPMNEAVMRGESLWHENMPFALAERAEGAISYFSFSYTPLLDDDGRIGGLFCSAIETTSTIRLAQAHVDQVQRQRRLFEQAPGFICTLQGPDHVFDFVNVAYQRLFRRGNIVGKTVRQVFPELEGQGYFERLDHVFDSGERYVADAVPARVRGEDGTRDRELLLSFVYAPVFDEAGQVTGIFCEGQDVTESHAVQQALQEKEEQLRLATEAAEVGLWDVDVLNDTMFWQPRVKAMFGISPEVPVALADFYGGLHPEDRDATRAAFAAAADPQRRTLYDVEYRTIGREDGVLRWVAAKGRGIFDANGRCVRVIGTAIDISGRKAAEGAQREAARRKDEFIATLAHELRNPLAPLRNAVHILRARGATDDATARLHGMMDRQLAHLVRLVDDLLEMSRISQGTLELRMAPVAVADFLAAAREAAEPLLRERGHELAVRLPPVPLWVAGDAVRLAQLVSNLLNNAAHYTAPGGQVRIDVQAQDGEVVLQVSDTGRGFTPADRERIFELFARGDGSGGLGIGLALGRKLAQMHGGSLQGDSAGPGQGAVFTVRLPVAPTPALAMAAQPSAAGGLQAMRVLVVDDNVDAAESLQLLLHELGAQVVVAHNGADALAQFGTLQPSAVLLDIGMPGMDGYEVARRLRTQFAASRFAIVGLSGWGQARDRERGRAAGFDHHLVKPADLATLRELLESLAR